MLPEIFQAFIGGLAVGGVYALMALGFSITFTTTRTLNFSQGEFVSTGAFIYVSALLLLSRQSSNIGAVQLSAELGPELVGLFAALAIMGALGVVLFYVGVRPFTGKPGLAWVVSTLGFGVILQSVGLALWGPGSVVVPSPVGDGLLEIFGAGIRRQELVVICTAVLVMVAMDVLMRRTMLGKVMRAVAHSGQLASLMGINVNVVMAAAFGISSALAALSGLLIAPIATASLFLGLAFGLKGFSAAIVGGLNNPRGCVIGGFALGVLESMVNLWQAQWRDIFVFMVVIVVLAFKPNGLFGLTTVEKA
ncbi:MAG: branched-chain amino acid ABC transporter permease [Pseudomonadota bacterium]